MLELRNWVGEQVGAIAKPDDIRFSDNLPKTRSGKIMRRLLRSIARGEEILQDVSTLENPAILEQLNHDGIEGEQIDDFDAIAARVARDARDGDVVIVMSSGAFGGVHEKILEALRS